MEKKLLIKKERTTTVDGRKVILSKFEKHLVNSEQNFSTQFGIIKKEDLKDEEVEVGKEKFYILDADFYDEYRNIKRLAQIISLKDIGAIIANTGINKESIVMDAGTGSAGLSGYLGAIAKKVISYDINAEHQKVAEKNIKKLKLKNVELKKGDIYKPTEIKEKEIDILILDVTEPWKAVKTGEKVLKKGGFIVSYSPNINQAEKFVKTLGEKFLYEKTIEIMEREWTIKDQILRPKTKDVGHTAFLSFARKIKK